jgi:hypothetical protein
MMIPAELDGGSRRQDDPYGRAVVGTGKSGVPADSSLTRYVPVVLPARQLATNTSMTFTPRNRSRSTATHLTLGK